MIGLKPRQKNGNGNGNGIPQRVVRGHLAVRPEEACGLHRADARQLDHLVSDQWSTRGHVALPFNRYSELWNAVH